MQIAIVGAGNMGSALAHRWVKAGHSVSLCFNRDPARLAALAAALGPNAAVATPIEAVSAADAVLLSVPIHALDEAVAAIEAVAAAKPLITTVSPYAADFAGEAVNLISKLEARSAAEEIAARLPTFHVVEAFNLIFADFLSSQTPLTGERPPTVPLCGDNAEARAMVAQLIGDAGLVPLDVGSLRVARVLEQMATAWVQLAAASGLFPMTGLSLLTPSSSSHFDQGAST
jgi:predicted dinucleotide-binding enzyme